jgi:hypothetical protein
VFLAALKTNDMKQISAGTRRRNSMTRLSRRLDSSGIANANGYDAGIIRV